MSDVLTVGELLAEFMAERVGQTFSEPGTFLGPYPSGAPAIFADQVAKTGTSSAMVGWVTQSIDLERTLTLANAAGAMAVTKRGPMEGNTSLSELELFVASAERTP